MKRQWDEDRIDTHWTLSASEHALLARRTGHGRFGFAVLLKFFQHERRFPDSRRELPAEVVRHMALQLSMPINALERFDWAGRTAKRQRTEILAWLGVRRMAINDWALLSTWIRTNLLPSDHSLEQRTERTDEWLRAQGLHTPGATRLEKVLRAEVHAYEAELLHGITDCISGPSREALDRLLGVDAEDESEPAKTDATPQDDLSREISFSQLRGDAGRASLDTLLGELLKLETLRKLNLPNRAIEGLPSKWRQKFRLRASVESIWDLRRHPAHVRYAIMAAFCFQRQHEIIDGLIDLLMQIIHKIDTRAEKKVEAEALNQQGKYVLRTNAFESFASAIPVAKLLLLAPQLAVVSVGLR